MPLKKLRKAPHKEEGRGGDNPQVIIETFQHHYEEWKDNFDDLDENDPDRV